MLTVYYLRVVGCEHVAARGAERNDGKGHRNSKSSLRRPTCITKKTLKRTNSTSTDVLIGAA